MTSRPIHTAEFESNKDSETFSYIIVKHSIIFNAILRCFNTLHKFSLQIYSQIPLYF